MQMMTEKEAAIYLAVKPKTLRQWRWAGRGPRFHRYHRMGGAIRYDLRDLEDYRHQARERSRVWLGGELAAMAS